MHRHNFHSLLYLPHHRVKSLSPLFVAATLRQLAVSLVGIFVPLYVLKLTGSFGCVLGFFWLLAFFSFIFDWPFSKLVSLLGFRRSVVAGNFFLLAKIVFLVLASRKPLFLLAAAFFGGAAISPYWLAYHTIFSEDGRKEAFGLEIGVMGVFSRLAAVAGPLIGGLIITFWGFNALYLLSFVFIFCSGWPLFFMPHHPKHRAPKASELFSYFRTADGKRWFFTFWSRNLESNVLALAWPVFLFLIVGSYETVGGIASASLLVSLLLLLFGGKLSDLLGKTKVLEFGGSGTAVAWLLMGLVRTSGRAFAFSTLLKTVRIFLWVPFDALTYTKASGGWAFKFLTFRELSLHSGALLSIGLIFLFWKLSFPWLAIFSLASLGSLGVVLLRRGAGD